MPMNDEQLFERIFDKLDTYENRLNVTCTTMTEIKTTLVDFISSVEKSEREAKDVLDRKYKNTTITFGTITMISVLIGITKSLGVF